MHPFVKKIKKIVLANLLVILTMGGVAVGIILGFILRIRKNWSPREAMYVQYIGDLFLRMLKALILPLIVSSIVTAIGTLDLSLSKQIGTKAMVYYITTTILAVILGIILVSIIQPGKGRAMPPRDDSDIKRTKGKEGLTSDTLMDLLRNLFPPNLIEATFRSHRTTLLPQEKDPDGKLPKEKWIIKEGFSDSNTNFLGLVFFSIVLGVVLGRMGEKGKPLLDVFVSLSEATMVMTKWVIWISPIGVCFLIAGSLVRERDLGELLKSVGIYFCTVLAGLFIHGLIVLPIIYTVITKKLPFRYLTNMSQAMATAFGTASSSATLPVTIECVEVKNRIDARVARFVLPIGATINMDGTALYEAVAAIWLAQLHGTELNFGKIIGISIAATAAAIGAAGIPQAGIVTMVMVLNTIGLPAEYVSYVLPVDWLLDRFRTMINVLGDAIGAGIVYHLCKRDLEALIPNPNEDEEADVEEKPTEASLYSDVNVSGSVQADSASASEASGSEEKKIDVQKDKGAIP